MRSIEHVRSLPDSSLLHRLAIRVADRRVLDAELLVLIDEIDQRKLYLEEGWPSMYLYLVRVHRLSEAATYRRITAARAARRFPQMFDHLATGDLTLSAIGVLAPHLGDTDAAKLIERARCCTKRQVEQMVVDRRPLPEVPTRLRPLGNDRLSLELTVSVAFKDKLEEAQSLMRHQNPRGDVATVLERGLDLLIEQLQKQRSTDSPAPRKRKPTRKKSRGKKTQNSRHIPADVRREVIARDGAQCTFVSANGQRCPERGFIQLHHVQPHALGGPPTVENLRVLCGPHNRREAERVFGKDYMERVMSSSREESHRDKADGTST